MADVLPQFPVNEEARGAKPRAFTLELTKGCNLRCGYCYYAEREDAYDPRTRMSEEVAEQSVETLLRDGPDGEPIHLHLFGGEPLLAPELLMHTVRYAARRAAECGKGATFEVTTNGTRLSDEIVAFLNEHKVNVGISFDGPPDVQDVARPAAPGKSSYEMAEPGIRRLLESRKGTDLEDLVHCSVVVTKNEPNLVRIVEHLEDMGFRNILLTPATDLEGKSNGFSDDDLPDLLAAYDALADDYEKRIRAGRPVSARVYPIMMSRILSGERKMHFCGGGRDYLGVSAEGEVSLCYRFYEDDEFSMGSVQEGITTEVTERLDEHAIDKRTECSSCWARYFCGGGCHHDNVESGRGLGEPNPVYCDIFRHTMDRTLDAWGRLSRDGFLGARAAVQPLPAAIANGANGSQTAPVNNDPWTDGDKPKTAPSCHVRELSGEKVVYDPKTHEVVVLNRTAAFIFELCDGSRSVKDLEQALCERYEAPTEILRRDLEATLSDLRGKGIVAS